MLIENEADKLLMIPGPTPVHHDILTALAQPTIAHSSQVLADLIQDALDGIRLTAGTSAASVFVFAGSGTLAQETALVNLVAPGERVLVASNGYFGDRFVDMAQAHGIDATRLAAPWGKSITAEQLRAALTNGQYRAVTITQVDTSTGTAAPVAELAEAARSSGALVILDSVCALGGMPVDMDSLGLDLVLTGAQKALGVPPGLAILAVSERAMARRRSIGRISSYYTDLLRWEASMQDPRTYFSTHAVNHFYALHAALDIVRREGLSQRIARHEHLASAFRAGAGALGFVPFTQHQYLAPTLSVLAYPPGVDDEPFRVALAERGVVSAGCLGEFKGKGVRFGHMGNIGPADILQTIGAVESSLAAVGAEVEPGAGLAAVEQILLQDAATP